MNSATARMRTSRGRRLPLSPWLAPALVIVLASTSPARARPGNPKLEQRLDAVARVALTGTPLAARRCAREHGLRMKGAAVEAVAIPWPGASWASIDQQALAARGAVVDAVSEVGVRLLVDPTDLRAVADEPTVRFLRPPLTPVEAVVSEGVALTGADDFHAAGIDGSGVTVAVIDLGFIGLSSAITAGEVPADAETFDYTGTGIQAGTEHGTAVAEVVHDMAPGAHLLLMKVDDELDLAQAEQDALAHGARVANHSVGWVNSSFYDGTGPISAVADDARAHGMLWCNAAGNDARRHWQGMFTDTSGNDWHEFSGGDEGNVLATGSSVRYIFLTWNDWPTSDQDLDLYLLDKNGNIVGASDGPQTGTQEPTEAMVVWPVGPAPFRVAVHAYSVTRPLEIELFSFDHDFTYQVAASSLMDPANAAGATVVGAISVANYATGPIEYFSSRGPTNDGRTKPDLCGPDGNTNYIYGSFYGTSSASPHVAGAAALLLDQDPSLTVDQLHARLESDTIDMGTPGKDNTYGAGRLVLPPPNVAPTCTVAASPDPVDCLTATTVTVTAQDADGTVVAYDVDYGDGTAHGAAAVIEHTYALAGQYTIAVVVTDDGGAQGACSTTVTVNNLPPICAITLSPAEPDAGALVTFHANASDPCGTVVSGWWDFGDGSAAAGLDVTHTYGAPGFYHVCATVTDDQGGDAICCTDVVVHGGEMICWTLPGPCWHMITIPCYPVDPRPEAVFRDEFGAPIPISGNLHRYDHAGQGYVTYWEQSPTAFGLIEPGAGYWLYVFEPVTICYEAVCPAEPPSQHFATAGWYLMGMPAPVSVGADQALWYQGEVGPATLASIGNLWVQDPLLGYDCALSSYVSHGVLPTDESHTFPAFHGYWLYAFANDVTLVIP